MLVTAAACFAQGDPSNPVGATLVDGRPAVVATLCEGEGVESVFITETSTPPENGMTLWRIDAADGPVRQDTFVIGEVPEGFIATTPLEGGVPRRGVTAWVRTDSDVEMLGLLDFREVEEGRIYVDLDPVSRESFRKARFCS